MIRPRLAVVAVGGNALIQDRDHVAIEDQAIQAAATCEHIADLVVDGWRVVLTHGNGPQVGFILHRSAVAKGQTPEVPLVYAVADTQGALGFMMQQGLRNALAARGRDASVVSVVTRVLVDADDPAFEAPTKPIGAHMDEDDARELGDRYGWAVAEDVGRGWRRIVASPRPLAIVELAAIEHLIDGGHVVVAAGGGGIPVVDRDGRLEGMDAVIDKDATSSLLARHLGADAFALVTGVSKVALHFGTPRQEWLDDLTVDRAEALVRDDHFDAGSMGPKVEAAISFVRANPAGTAIITDAPSLGASLRGEAGTRITAGGGVPGGSQGS
jgi:carbamate kinase